MPVPNISAGIYVHALLQVCLVIRLRMNAVSTCTCSLPRLIKIDYFIVVETEDQCYKYDDVVTKEMEAEEAILEQKTKKQEENDRKKLAEVKKIYKVSFFNCLCLSIQV